MATVADGLTTFIQTNVEEFLADSHCEKCLVPLTRVYEPDRYGCVEVHNELDHNGDLVGFLCPTCAPR